MNTLRTLDGGQRVDTDQGCSACQGDCPCPQACERRMDTTQADGPLSSPGVWLGGVVGLVLWTLIYAALCA